MAYGPGYGYYGRSYRSGGAYDNPQLRLVSSLI